MAIDNYTFERVEERPANENLKEGVVYLVHEKSAFLRCPCGCGDILYLNRSKTRRPCWDIEAHDENVTIIPSVHRQEDCRSHFFITNSKVKMC